MAGSSALNWRCVSFIARVVYVLVEGRAIVGDKPHVRTIMKGSGVRLSPSMKSPTLWTPLYFRTWLMRARCKAVNKSVLHTCPMKLLSSDGSKGVCHFLLRAKVTQERWHSCHRRFHHPSVARFPSRVKSSSKILLLMPTSIWNTSKLCCSIRPVAVGWLN